MSKIRLDRNTYTSKQEAIEDSDIGDVVKVNGMMFIVNDEWQLDPLQDEGTKVPSMKAFKQLQKDHKALVKRVEEFDAFDKKTRNVIGQLDSRIKELKSVVKAILHFEGNFEILEDPSDLLAWGFSIASDNGEKN